MSRLTRIAVLVFFSVSLCAMSTAVIVPPYITATSTATLVNGGQYDGWYKYTIDFNWYFEGPGSGLSHWDIILKPGCAEDDHLIEFDTWAGYSTSEDFPDDPGALGWTGFFEKNGDGSIPDVTDPIVKFDEPFDPDDDEPGKQGYGTFCFYSNIIPENGTFEDKIVSKGGSGVGVVFGDLQGDYPSCTIVPEPATMAIMVMGLSALVIRRCKS